MCWAAATSLMCLSNCHAWHKCVPHYYKYTHSTVIEIYILPKLHTHFYNMFIFFVSLKSWMFKIILVLVNGNELLNVVCCSKFFRVLTTKCFFDLSPSFKLINERVGLFLYCVWIIAESDETSELVSRKLKTLRADKCLKNVNNSILNMVLMEL